MVRDHLVHRRGFLTGALLGLAGLSALPLAGAVAQTEDESPSDPARPADVAPAADQPAPEPLLEGPAEAPVPTTIDVVGPPDFVPYGIPPASIAIPALGVEARVSGVARDEDGSMSAPSDPDGVAWYTLGPGMGVGGNVVFAAHINWGGVVRVFGHLDRLERGDAVLVVDANGNGYEYRVESSRWVRAEGAPVEEIFDQNDAPVITLITCGGEYRAATREYLDRLVVRARG